MKNTIIIILAIISLGLIGYIGYTTMSSPDIGSDEAKTKAEKFINENLLQPGSTATISEVSKANGLYKLHLRLPDNSETDAYITKDGQVLFPQAINIEEALQEISANSQNNNQNPMELQTEILTEGSGDAVVKTGDTISVDYTGTLEDGTQFDSSIGREPFSFTIGQGAVIQGWDQGLLGMKVGEERKLTIPSEMGYGASGSGPIPPNATLIFTVKLISIK